MTSAEHRPAARLATLVATAAAGLSIVAPAASGDIVRVTQVSPDDGRTASTTSVAVFPATARGGHVPDVAVTGVEDLSDLLPSPDGASLAWLGTTSGFGAPESVRAGVLPVAGGAGRPFAPRELDDAAPDPFPVAFDGATPWLSWAPSGAGVVVHGLTSEQRADPWVGPPTSRRCAVADLACAPARSEDVIDLAGGGTVRVRAGITAPVDAHRTLDPDAPGARRTARALRVRAGRRYAVEVRVSGRTGPGATWAVSGVLRRGAPAYDRAYPSAAGVLVRTTTVRAPADRRRGLVLGVTAAAARAVLVRADGRIRPLGRFDYDVVGTLPDGRWLLAGGVQRPIPRGPAGAPLRTLDADGRIRPLRSGPRPITPVWAANQAGLPDSQSRIARVGSAAVDASSGLLVLQLLAENEAPFDGVTAQPLVAVTLDGTAPPALVRPPAGARGSGVTTTYVVR